MPAIRVRIALALCGPSSGDERHSPTPRLPTVTIGEAGAPKLILVGLPNAAVKESDDRVVSALSNSGYRAPRTRTTINLAPGNRRKKGPCYDLPMALGILAATKQLNAKHLGEWLIADEVSWTADARCRI